MTVDQSIRIEETGKDTIIAFVDKKYSHSLRIKSNTKKNGINIVSVFTIDNKINGFKYLFENEELKEYYGKWSIIEYKKYVTKKGYKSVYIIVKKTKN